MQKNKSSVVAQVEDAGAGEPVYRSTAAGVGANTRKKAAGVRSWLLLDTTGQSQVVDAGKHSIMRRTGLPARDLRILDPLLSYPSTILGRERAIVINLEQIKAIITGNEVLLLNSKDPLVAPFAEDLQRKIRRHFEVTKSQEAKEDHNSNCTNYSKSDRSEEEFQGKMEERQLSNSAGNRQGPKLLPFEFVALEACLEAACSCLDNEARTLEEEAHPTMDKLTSKISTLNLERVRQLKSRLVAITGRVQKVRDELENLLDDDNDMVEMYLTEKSIKQQLENDSNSSSIDEKHVSDEEQEEEEEEEYIDSDERINSDHESDVISKRVDVEELEMLLEAYFVQIEGTVNKLSTLREYVDDTEDYINIMLDDKQNQLLRMGVMLTTATLVVTSFVVVTGILGMNIRIEIFNDQAHGMERFFWTVGGGSAGSIGLFVIAMAWYKYKRFLD